jgi:Transglycosylase SLT domain
MSERGAGRAHRCWVKLLVIITAAAICSVPADQPIAAGRKAAKARALHKHAPIQPIHHVRLEPTHPVHIEKVSFAGPGLAPVTVVRGGSGLGARRQGEQVEVVSFGRAHVQKVTIVRGVAPSATKIGRPPEPAQQARIETVAFADPNKSPVKVVRGPSLGDVAIELFGPAKSGELDRIAFAVDGIESRHGADPAMWRPEPDGPQGPMQVSLKAALDVGGGDRFDLRENRLLGRAYLAQLYRRYGNWADALAAYNWGPGNLDQWIAAGRRADMLPLDVLRYVERALRDALLTTRRL